MLGDSILDFALAVPHREIIRAVGDSGKVQHHLDQFSDSQSIDEYWYGKQHWFCPFYRTICEY
jgi:hypothetical protein